LSLRWSRQEWEDLAALDPLFSVLSQPGTRGGGWDQEGFFLTGETYVRGLMARAEDFGHPAARGAALDFGCGVGRLTRALARHFESCLGVDISPAMIEQARRINAAWPSCRFEVVSDLRALESGSFDLVLTKSVLQHLPDRRAMVASLTELVRLLRPNGLLAAQVPSHLPLRRRLQLSPRLYRLLRRMGVPRDVLYHRLRLTPIRMLTLSPSRVEEAIHAGGGRLVGVDRNLRGSSDEIHYATRRP